MLLTPQQYFRLSGTKPRKRFGQHFLVQSRTAEQIVESAALDPTEVVIEVGPGLGALTQHLLPKVKRLHLIELDRDLAGYLQDALPPSTAQVTIHPQDVLTFDFTSLSRMEGQRIVVVGNLPYNISSPLVFHLLESRAVIDRSVFMVQKEVGERLAASPGSKDYGPLSVMLGVYAQVTSLFTVGPRQFYPPPQVESLVVRIDFKAASSEEDFSFDFLRKVVNTAFQQRRKTLHNSLKGLGLPAMRIEEAFTATAIDPKRRPETLSAEEFVRLTQALSAPAKASPENTP